MKIRRGIFLVALFVGVFVISGHALAGEDGYQFVTKWGCFGWAKIYPQGMAIDASGNLYVTDGSSHSIAKFTSDGDYITQWGCYGYGSGNDKFAYPRGVAVDTSGNVYVVDWGHGIKKFTSDGAFIAQWGSMGSGIGQFNSPEGVAVDAAGDVFVADTSNERIQKFTSDGAYINQWGSFGHGNGQFDLLLGVAVDAFGNVYVADRGNNRIQKFAPPEKVNDLVSFSPISSTYSFTYDTSGCPAGFAGKSCFQARLAGKATSPSLTGLIIEVAKLTNGNLLLNSDGGPGGAGSWMTVPKYMGNADSALGPGEYVYIPFVLCLKQRKSFSFFVDVLGIAQ